MASSRYSNPIQIGDNASAVNSTNAAATAQQLLDYNNPTVTTFVRIPLAGQTIVTYKVPTGAVILDHWLDITTVWSSGAVNVGTTSNGTEIGTFTTLTAVGRLDPTLTAARITNSKASTLGVGQVPVYISPSTTAGSGVGELVLLVGYAGFKSTD